MVWVRAYFPDPFYARKGWCIAKYGTLLLLLWSKIERGRAV